MKIRDFGLLAPAVLVMALTAASCNSATKPEVPSAVVQSLRYEHVADFAIQSDTRIEFEYTDCTRGGHGPIPDKCPLVLDSGNVYRCPLSNFMKTVPTTCDSIVEVRFREPSGNLLFGTGHNIYVNGTRLSRLVSRGLGLLSNEFALVRFDADGSVR